MRRHVAPPSAGAASWLAHRLLSKTWLLLLAALVVAPLSGCNSTQRAVVKVAYKGYKAYRGYQKDQKRRQQERQDDGRRGQDDGRRGGGGSDLAAACRKLGVSAQGVGNKLLYTEAASLLGARYKYGGSSQAEGFDCSGLTGRIYRTVYNKGLMRNSADILRTNCRRIDKGQLREGDLVFFRTDGKRSSEPNHVGVYLKEGQFIHASTSKGVVVSSLKQDYYVRNWIAGGRVK